MESNKLADFLYNINSFSEIEQLEMIMNNKELKPFMHEVVTPQMIIKGLYGNKQSINDVEEFKQAFFVFITFLTTQEYMRLLSNIYSCSLVMRDFQKVPIEKFLVTMLSSLAYNRGLAFKDFQENDSLVLFDILPLDRQVYIETNNSNHDLYMQKIKESCYSKQNDLNLFLNILKRELPNHFFNTLECICNEFKPNIDLYARDTEYISRLSNLPKNDTNLLAYKEFYKQHETDTNIYSHNIFTTRENSDNFEIEPSLLLKIESYNMSLALEKFKGIEKVFKDFPTLRLSPNESERNIKFNSKKSMKYPILSLKAMLPIFDNIELLDIFSDFYHKNCSDDIFKHVQKLKEKRYGKQELLIEDIFNNPKRLKQISDNKKTNSKVFIEYQNFAKELVKEISPLSPYVFYYLELPLTDLLENPIHVTEDEYNTMLYFIANQFAKYSKYSSETKYYMEQLEKIGFSLEFRKELFKLILDYPHTTLRLDYIINGCLVKKYAYHKDFYNLPEDFLVGELGFLELTGDLNEIE